MKRKYAKVNMRQRINDEEFNLELLVAHADAGVQEQREMDEANDDANMIAL
jgi:hypothetical protein